MNVKLLILFGACLLLGLETLTAQVTYRVYATRLGLVGETTANGHVIAERDNFVALPSGTVLNAPGEHNFTVTIHNPQNGKTATHVPVWDVGPWNCDDDYWSTNRDPLITPALPRGLPQAEAAFFDGHHGGKDFSSSCGPGRTDRTVLNGAGIDLADGTFWDELGMTSNGWVDVTFHWESPDPAAGGIVVDNDDSRFNASGNWGTATWAQDKHGSDYRWRDTEAVGDAATWNFDIQTRGDYEVFAWWSAAANRATAAPYIVDHANGSTTVPMDQSQNGGQWNSLGTFRFGGGTSTSHSVRLSCWTSSGDVVVADAILVVPKVVWVDNQHSGFQASTNWSTGSGSQAFGPDYRFRDTAATSDVATWTAQGLTAGTYEVQARWSAGLDRASAAPYLVHRLGGSSTVHADQTTDGWTMEYARHLHSR